MLVEVDMNGDLPDVINFVNEKGTVVEQKVQYDWKPTLCSHCKKYGHGVEECRKVKSKETAGMKQMEQLADSKPEESVRVHKWMPQKGASIYVEGNGEAQRGLREDKTLSEQGRKYKERSKIMGAGVSSGSTQGVQLEQGNTFQILEGIEPEYEMQIPRNTPTKNGGETKIKEVNVEKVAKNLFEGWGMETNPEQHMGGRILMFWKPDCFTVRKVFCTAQ
ncbi:hypothetical protein HAX54_001074, partial [Datura stramonium]|nr:hypothetical protein [Datura stramonium]